MANEHYTRDEIASLANEVADRVIKEITLALHEARPNYNCSDDFECTNVYNCLSPHSCSNRYSAKSEDCDATSFTCSPGRFDCSSPFTCPNKFTG